MMLPSIEIRRIVGFVSAVIGLLCYALSSSFNHLFGDWNLTKIFLYFTFSFIIFITTLFGQKQSQSISTRALFKTHMAVLILLVTTVYSYLYDKAVNEKPDTYILISCFAFAVMCLSLSKDLANYFLGCLIMLLMKINWWLFFVGAGFSYSLLIFFHSSSNPPLPLHYKASSFWTRMMRSRFGHIRSPRMRGTSTLHARSTVNAVELLGCHENTDHPCNSQLRNYAQRNNLDPPIFSSNTEAEQAAAEVALMSLADEISEKVASSSFKNKLQELTQRKRIVKPTYKTTQSGSPHKPTFFSIVKAESKEFHGEVAKSKKEAEKNAAKVAYLALKEYTDHPCNSQLRNYAQRNNLDPPIFSSNTEAEQAAAEVALMSLAYEISEKVASSSFKNKLQELTQRKRIVKPTYKTTQSGSPHKPTFFSIVKVESKEFHGEVAKSKKEAEKNAAKVAYLALKEFITDEHKELELEEIVIIC